MVHFCYELTAKRPFSATFKALFILWIIAADMTKVLEWLCMVSEKHTPPPMVCPEDILFYLTWFLNTSPHHVWWINYMSRSVFTKSWSTVKFTLCGFHQWKKSLERVIPTIYFISNCFHDVIFTVALSNYTITKLFLFSLHYYITSHL